MTDVVATPLWLAVAQIVLVDLVLSGDNAVVIALACRDLPPRQRRIGILCGVLGAVAARVVLTGFAAVLMGRPWLKLVGAVLLLWIAVQLIRGNEPGAGGARHDVQSSDRLWTAIYTVVMADAIMSLDNVVGVAAAARGSVPLLVFGLALSIPIVVLGSRIVLRLIEKLPVFILLGGGLLGYIAGEMAVTDPVAAAVLAPYLWVGLFAPLLGFFVVIAAGLALRRRARQAPA